MNLRFHSLFALAATLMSPLGAQDFTGTITLTGKTPINTTFTRGYAGVGQVGKSGSALIRISLAQALSESDYKSGEGPIAPTITFAFNRLDQITAFSAQGISDPSPTTVVIGGGVTGGTGAYNGATSPGGTLRLTLTRTPAPENGYRLTVTGAATVGGQPVDLAVTDVLLLPTGTTINLFDQETGTANITPLGSANAVVRSHPDTNNWQTSHFLEINIALNFSPTDILRLFLTIEGEDDGFGPITIAGGTGKFAGASGSGRIVSTTSAAGNDVINIAGTVTLAGPTTPIITSVNAAGGLGQGPQIVQNGWIEIKGTHLVPTATPAGGMFWSNAPEFAQGMLPTGLGPVSVTINGKPAHIWWFCSAASGPSCPADQINVLAPLDAYIGQVPVVVRNGTATSGVAIVNKLNTVPAFLLFSAKGEAVATHADGRLLGAASLFPGLSLPGARGETVSLWGAGFALPKEALTAGSATQSGTLPGRLACLLSGKPAPVAAALVSPGLYQFNVTIPQDAPTGDNHFYCTYADGVTPAVLLAVQ
ncbi:MAG: hypothetical protein ABI972_21110 [Acidobacteriota bacterium]